MQRHYQHAPDPLLLLRQGLSSSMALLAWLHDCAKLPDLYSRLSRSVFSVISHLLTELPLSRPSSRYRCCPTATIIWASTAAPVSLCTTIGSYLLISGLLCSSTYTDLPSLWAPPSTCQRTQDAKRLLALVTALSLLLAKEILLLVASDG